MKTLMLFRCTTLEFAQRFLATGNIRFGLPQEWIDQYKKFGPGRGDLLEGAFAAIEELDKRPIDFYNAIRPHVKMSDNSKQGFYYFQSEDVLKLRTLCLFGLNDNMFPEQVIAEDKRSYPYGKISKKYFTDFAPDVTEENYNSLKPKEKPVLLMINNPHGFFNRLRKYLHSLGLSDSEFIIRPVKYINMHTQFLVNAAMPEELFFKDSSFHDQSEIRIVICSRNKETVQRIDEMDGIFNIGAMDDIADIKEYYFKDFVMERRGDKLLFALPKPKTVEPSKEKLMGIINQILCNRVPEGCIKGNYTKEEQIALTAKKLKDKYHICFDRANLTFYADENYKPTDPNDWGRIWTLKNVDEVLYGDGCLLYERQNYNEAVKNFSDAISITPSRADFWCNRGCAYFRLTKYSKALDDYSKAIQLDPNNAKYYLERSKVYTALGVPEKAQADFNEGNAIISTTEGKASPTSS